MTHVKSKEPTKQVNETDKKFMCNECGRTEWGEEAHYPICSQSVDEWFNKVKMVQMLED